ncbi:hypothetical protein FO519_007823 [Halicephalobus sp. NKZ332]|nr:hypothetical protein FO519_007823 [Halicephalobus sp. NKZ332]
MIKMMERDVESPNPETNNKPGFTWTKVVCVLGALLMMGELVQVIIYKLFDTTTIILLAAGFFAFGSMIFGTVFWRRFYKILKIYLFYMGIWIIFDLGSLGEITVAAIMASNRKMDPVEGKIFETIALASLYSAALTAIELLAYILCFAVIYVEYKYLKGKILFILRINLLNIVALIFGYFCYGCMLVGVFFWRRFYKLLNVYIFYMGVWVVLNFGYLGQLIIVTVMEVQRGSDPVNGQSFKKKAIEGLYAAVMSALLLFIYILGIFIVYIEYKYLKGRVENGIT